MHDVFYVGRQFGKLSSANQHSFGCELESWEWEKERAARAARKEKQRKERENCLHGRALFPIKWSNNG